MNVVRVIPPDQDVAVSAFGPEDLNRRCVTPDGASITTWKWLRSMIEHEIHHRGQIYIYLSLLDTPAPPLYGLSSEQLLERSIPRPQPAP